MQKFKIGDQVKGQHHKVETKIVPYTGKIALDYGDNSYIIENKTDKFLVDLQDDTMELLSTPEAFQYKGKGNE